MNARVPTRVVLYTLLKDRRWTACAEFNFSTESGVTLIVHDGEHGGDLAQGYFDRGAPNDEERRVVGRDDPVKFMNTLLQPTQSTFYRWVDESDAPTDGA